MKYKSRYNLSIKIKDVIQTSIVEENNERLTGISAEWECVFVESLLKQIKIINVKDPTPKELQDVPTWNWDI